MRFGLLSSPDFLLHDTADHVENAGRLRAIESALQGLEGTTPLAPRLATDEEILRLHLGRVIERVEATAAQGGDWLDGDTFCSAASARVARLAAGGVMELAAQVALGQLDRGFALVRPPGHHATPGRSMGFCLYSNIALAARHCLEQGLQRVFIFDWDVHHGNGTQDCLYADPNTCFFSFHQSPLYPGTGRLEERGSGPGLNLTYNLPLPAGMRDADYLYAMDHLVKPVMLRYDPQLVLVSAGYDAHEDDPLGGMRISTAGFAAMAARLASWADATSAQGKIVGVLEGGYNPLRLAQSVRATIDSWLNPQQESFEEIPYQAVAPACRSQVEIAASLWRLS